jgi:hypothetical protein
MAAMDMLTIEPPGWPVGRRFDPIPMPPADHPPYVHVEGCRGVGSDPPWELNLDTLMWERRCGQHRDCAIRQTWQSSVPSPPKPDDDALADFMRHHGEDHVELVLELLDVRPDGRRLGVWVARCEGCKAAHSWTAGAIEHYLGHGIALRRTPPGPMTLDQLVGAPSS